MVRVALMVITPEQPLRGLELALTSLFNVQSAFAVIPKKTKERMASNWRCNSRFILLDFVVLSEEPLLLKGFCFAYTPKNKKGFQFRFGESRKLDE
jgi:hypothetical protein